MGRHSFVCLGILVVAGCASSRPPLLPDDGQYRAPTPPTLTELVPEQEAERAPERRGLFGLFNRARRDDGGVETASAPTQDDILPQDEIILPEGDVLPSELLAVAPGEVPLTAPAAPLSQPRFPELPPAEGINPAPQPSATSGNDPYFSTAPRLPELERAVPAAQSAPLDLSRAIEIPEATQSPSARPISPTVTPIQAQTDDLQRVAAEQALAEVNAYRAEHGYEPLRLSDALNAVAREHVIDLVARNEVSSLNRDGGGIGVRLVNAGYPARVAGSLVSGGYRTFGDAMQSWRSNDVQRSRLLLPQAEEIGFAVITDPQSTYGTYIEAIVAGR